MDLCRTGVNGEKVRAEELGGLQMHTFRNVFWSFLARSFLRTHPHLQLSVGFHPLSLRRLLSAIKLLSKVPTNKLLQVNER